MSWTHALAHSLLRCRVWDLASGRCLQTLEGHEGAVYCIAFSPDSKLLVSGAEDTLIK